MATLLASFGAGSCETGNLSSGWCWGFQPGRKEIERDTEILETKCEENANNGSIMAV